MASVSIYDIWRHGLAAVTTLAEAAEAGDESPRRRRLLSMAKEMQDCAGYEAPEMESPEIAEYVSDWYYASTSAAELGEGAEYGDWVLQVLAAGLENTTWLDTVRLEDAGRLDASCLHDIRDHGSERLGITSLPPSEDHKSRLLEHTSAPGPDEVPMPQRLCCEWLGDPPWSL